MEDLKNTITKTDTLKNDLKLAKQKINDKILSGGGTIANTISDVPNSIDKMLKENYKKVAIVNTQQFELPTNQSSKNFSVTTNFTFTPTICYLQAHAIAGPGGSGQIIAVDIKKINFVEGQTTAIRNIRLTHNQITFDCVAKNSAFNKITFKIIAIE